MAINYKNISYMYNKNLLSSIIISLFVLASCSSGGGNDDLESSTNPNFDLNKISGSQWALKKCPDLQLLTFNGYSECDYFEALEFIDNKVYIKHAGNDNPTLHHICFVNGNELAVSIQDCSNTTWEATFEWDVSLSSESTLVFNAKTPNLNKYYDGRFEFNRK